MFCMSRSITVLAVLCLAVGCLCDGALHWNSPRTGKPVSGALEEKLGGWPACDPTVQQYSGYFNINATTDKHYFYWAVTARSQNPRAPLVVYLNGGPGCSSLLPMLAENIGPCNVDPNMTLRRNPYSWNKEANVIYIDQPAGVGFSYASGPSDHNEDEVGEDMYWFMQAVYRAHPEWQPNEFYVVGVSYGGHYAPATAHRIWQGNMRREGIHINLKGVGMGNGLVDAYVQYQYFAPMAYDYCKKQIGVPCVTEQAYNEMRAALPMCLYFTKYCRNHSDVGCQLAWQSCNTQMAVYAQTGRDMYDIRNNSDYDFSGVDLFLNRADVKAALGVRADAKWEVCNDTVHAGFIADWFQDISLLVPDLLASNIRVLIFAGNMDFICNWVGNKAWTMEMAWPHRDEFRNLTDIAWKVDGKEVGFSRTISTPSEQLLFTFLEVHNAGHMVPLNQPRVGQVMLQHLMNGTRFLVDW